MNNQQLMESAQEIWGLSSTELVQAKQSSTKYRMKHGMFASVPLICKDSKCPYSPVCSIPSGQRTVGGRCPVEIGAILSRFESWCRHFLIDIEDEFIKDEDLVDASLIRDLVDNEIQTMRAENKLAISGDFIGETINTVDNKGNPWYENVVTPEAEFKLTLQDKRQKILNLLNATRKDKSRELNNQLNPSEKTLSIFNDIKDKLKDIDLDNIGDDINGNNSKIVE